MADDNKVAETITAVEGLVKAVPVISGSFATSIEGNRYISANCC
jgi:hypothetical protein